MKMQSWERDLSLLVEEIERTEMTRQGFGSVMLKIKNTIDLGRFPTISADTVESVFTKKIKPVDLTGLKIAGVDGGLVRKRFRSMDLLLTRGIAVIFRFGPKEGPDVDFCPSPFPEPRVKPINLALAGPELDQLASLERVITELKVTLTVLEKYHTDMILLDGSLFYHPRDRPQNGSHVYEKFQEAVALYRQLYHQARKKNVLLVGIVKDSRSSRIVNILSDILPHIVRNPEIFESLQGIDYRWLLKLSRDCDILDTFLEEGERTFAFRYSAELTQNANTLSDDLSVWASSILVSYVRTARNDFPLRVEVLVDPDLGIKQLDKAIATILPLSSSHPEYGIPAPILEADARARISNNETKMIIDRLMALSGLTYTTLERRRSRNPFGR
jgi:hypothetical protein